MQHLYRSCQTKEPDLCYEILGFDIMLDQKLKPWLIEVNHTPSFAAETGVDEDIKRELITHALEIVKLSVDNRKRIDKELKLEMRE